MGTQSEQSAQQSAKQPDEQATSTPCRDLYFAALAARAQLGDLVHDEVASKDQHEAYCLLGDAIKNFDNDPCPAPRFMPHFEITVRGGCIEDVICDYPLDYTIVDYDNDHCNQGD